MDPFETWAITLISAHCEVSNLIGTKLRGPNRQNSMLHFLHCWEYIDSFSFSERASVHILTRLTQLSIWVCWVGIITAIKNKKEKPGKRCPCRGAVAHYWWRKEIVFMFLEAREKSYKNYRSEIVIVNFFTTIIFQNNWPHCASMPGSIQIVLSKRIV